MAMLAQLNAIEDVDESLREHYVLKEGKLTLQITAGESGLVLENVGGLKSALERERGNAITSSNRVKEFEGMDAKEAKLALSKMDEIKNWDPDKKLDEAMKAREKDLLKQFGSDMKKVTDERDGLKRSLETNLIKRVASEAILSQKGKVGLLLPHIISQTRMRKTDAGDYVAEVINPETGTSRVGDSHGNGMTIQQLVTEFKGKEDFASAFEGSGASGSGAGAGGGGGSGGTGGAGGSSGGGAGGTGGGAGTVENPTKIKESDQSSIDKNMEGIAAGTHIVVEG